MRAKNDKKRLLKIQDCLPLIGVLRSTWVNSLGELKTLSYGTAFAIHKRVIITCAHNIVAPKQMQYCTQAVFVLNIDRSQIIQSTKIYKTVPINFIKNKASINQIINIPTKQELALLVLEEDLPNIYFLKIRSDDYLHGRYPLQIVGYPSEAYFDEKNLYEVTAMRNILAGRLHSIDKHIINHDMTDTKIGNSGSPILARNSKGEYEVVGIHTHKSTSPYYKSGLNFSDEVLVTINIFLEEIIKEHKISKLRSIQIEVEPAFKCFSIKRNSQLEVHDKLEEEGMNESQNDDDGIRSSNGSSLINFQDQNDQSFDSSQDSELSNSFRDFIFNNFLSKQGQQEYDLMSI